MDNSINSDLIRGHINTIILKALFEGDRYGYEICKEISERTMGQYVLKQPTLYSCLKRMEKNGFIKSYWGVGATGGGQRRYYALTELGKDIYLKNQKEWEFSRTIIDNLVSDKKFDLQKPILNKEYKKAMKTLHHLEKEYDEIENKMADTNYENKEDDEDTIDFESSKNQLQMEQQNRKIFEVMKSSVENNENVEDSQYDMFNKLDVNIDEKIDEYEKLKMHKKVYSKKSQLKAEKKYEEAKEKLLLENRDIAAYRAMVENMNNKSKSRVGFDALSSKFLFVPTNQPQSYTDAISTKEPSSENNLAMQSNQILQKQEEQSAPQPAPHEKVFYAELSENETKAEKEYRTILKKLLALTKNYIVSENENDAQEKNKIAAIQNNDKHEKAENSIRNLQIKKVDDDTKKHDSDEKVIQYKARESVEFSNMQSKMQTEGFKMRVRESQQVQKQNTQLSCKKMSSIVLTTSLIIFIFVLTQLAVMYFAIKQFEISFNLFIILTCSSLAIPLVGGICYAYYKNRKVPDRFKFSISFLFALIIAIAIYMVCVSIAFLTGVDFSINAAIMKNVVLPAILAINIPISVGVFALIKKKYN